MTDFYLPPDLVIAKAAPSLEANTSAFASPSVGSTRTVERLGDAYSFSIDFAPHNDNASSAWQRGRLQALLSRLRGQANRIYMTPPGARLRGSFPAAELFVNNDFSNGTNGWSNYAQYSISAANRVYRAKRLTNAASYPAYQLAPYTQYAPHVTRGIAQSSNAVPSLTAYMNGSVGLQIPFSAVYGGYAVSGAVPLDASGTSSSGFLDGTATGLLPGDYIDFFWTSMSRCALVDNSPNLLLYSDQFDNAAWSVNAATISANVQVAPDGTTTGDAIIESTTATVERYVGQGGMTITSGAVDVSFSVYVYPSRPYCYLRIYESAGSTYVGAAFNVSGGTVGTSLTTGANWSNVRSTIADAGGGWFKCTITGRKTNAATGITVYVNPLLTDTNTVTYAGTSGTTALRIWRGSVAVSAVPVKPRQTVATSSSGVSQSGTRLDLKGLPASTTGLLLYGDWIECNGQLNQVVGQLDSDAAGLGQVQLARPFRNAPADNAPFIVNNPLGKFMLSKNSAGWTENPGSISDASIELIEDISF